MKQVTSPARGVGRGGAAVALLIAILLAALVPGLRVAAQDPTAPAGGPTTTDATVRIVHGSPDAPAVDVLVDGQPAAPGLAFGTATEYLPLPAGDHQVQVVPAGGGQPLLEGSVTAESGHAYILAVVGMANALQLQAYDVNIDAIENPGQSRLRVIHAVPDAPAVDVAIAGGDPIVEGVEFPNGSDYVEHEAGTFDLEVRNGETDQALMTAPQQRFEAGQVYDLVALGQGPNLQLLPLVTPVSIPCSQTLGIGQPANACLRVVHASPDAGPVDVYLGETVLIPGLQFGLASSFAAAPNGEQHIRVVPAGAPLDQAAIDTNQTLESGQAYQITATGLVAEIEATVNQVDLTPLPEGQARLRVIHASPDTAAIDVALAGGATLAEGVEFRGSSDYAVIDAGNYGLQVREADGDTLLLEAPQTMLQAGMVYDVYAIGQTENGTAQLTVFTAPASTRTGQMATPIAGAPAATPAPAAIATPAVVVGASPVVEAPGAATPAATPTS
ncbi:MAG: hypothetical protein AVDCRST_MAG19-2440 [uncultured Thermomicrobiales bacterium]|uniref:DUF4397 domain-containing protein n=1 Tax=uncultured Thermomicrobiales bacterium TaxID=1645740 RepID=A0A6J4V5B4_9BACT|nr:MAG: hypothetical protein AVDCRST_MAG19-2440 [uncultured Thermomicrobiales bacterium]